MDLHELKALIVGGESDRLEFKRTTGERREAARTVCAMLNGLGGFVLFGVGDRGELIGQDVSARTTEEIAQELRRIDPPAFPGIETVPLDTRRSIIVLRVPGGSGLYRYDGRPYVRLGPTTSVMPQGEYERRLLDRLHATRRWENEPAARITLDDLDADEIQRTVETAVRQGRLEVPRDRDAEALLRGLGLIVDGTLLNAAVALYGQGERMRAYYPQCAIRLARFRGESRLADFADNRQYQGHLFDLLRRAESFLLDHVPVAGRVVAGKTVREDRPAYPPRATREAMANALCHREYAVSGGAVSVAMYDDRLEIANPGMFHFGVTPQLLFQPHESRPWNPIIASVLYRAGIIEQWGTGTLNMLEWCRQVGAPAPAYVEQNDAVVVRFLPAQPESRPESRPESQPESLADRVLRLLADGPLSRSELAARLGQRTVSGQLNTVIRTLLREERIAYTIPEKPQSRLQRYRVVTTGSSNSPKQMPSSPSGEQIAVITRK